MRPSIKNNVEEVVKHHLCLCCGACLAVCPKNAIVMTETVGGLLFPEIDDVTCNGCGLCLKVCPGTHLEKGLLSPQTDPFRGNCISAYCGQAADKDILRNGQSGGIVTALLEHLLDSGRINNTVVTQMPEDGSLRPKCIVTADSDAIRKSQGSQYCPVAAAAVAQKAIVQMGEKIAVVGLSCHLHGLANAQVHLGVPAPFRIGIVCDRMLTFGAIDYLIDKAGVNREDVASFQFRSKKFNGWPGDGCVRTKDGKEFCVENRHRMSIKDIYTPARCRLCFDKMNVLCDLVVGDAWGFRGDRQGSSVIVVRTDKGREALLSAQQAGIVKLENVDVEAVFKGQAVEKKRLDWTAFTTVWRDSGTPVPCFNFDEKWYGNIKGLDLGPFRNNISRAINMENMTSAADILEAAKREARLKKKRSSLSFCGFMRFIRKIWET